jgi:hypothetical protein
MANTAPSRDPFAAFEATLKKLVAVPKKVLDRKVRAFRRRKRTTRHP